MLPYVVNKYLVKIVRAPGVESDGAELCGMVLIEFLIILIFQVANFIHD